MSDPHIWLCDEPTMAIDVGTRSDIHALLRKRADEGDSILFVSSDLLEILEISDRILIMTNGTGNRTLINDGLDARQVLGYCYEPENGKDNDEI
jgi:ribose transport system ATP-binding protein